MVLNTEWAQVEVIDLVNDGTGLAFGIIGGRSTGVVVKTILPGGVADRDGRLQSGDHILQIGEVNLRGLGSEQVASVLRQCGVNVRMVVARPVESTTADYQALGSSAPIVPTKILCDPMELDRHLIENGYLDAQKGTPPPPSNNYTNRYIGSEASESQMHPISGIVDVVKRNPMPIGTVPEQKSNEGDVEKCKMLPLDMALHEPDLPETETLLIELRKDDLGLGITVAGYVCEKEEISGIFVKSISKGSVADLTKSININDRIIEVDGKSLMGCTNHQAVELIRSSGEIVRIKVERYLRGPKYEHLQQAIKANEEIRPSSPNSVTISSLPKVPLSLVRMSYLGIEPEDESRTSIDFDSTILLDGVSGNEDQEIVIGGEGLLRRSSQLNVSQETIYNKWREKLAQDVEIVVAEIDKEPTSGLGISLEGTVDVEDGKEVRPHHYIRNILSDGPIGKNGTLRTGDELIEVNGTQLLGLNHLDVVSILRQLTNYVCLVCARNSVPIRIIDTAQDKEAFRARKILAGSLQTLIPSITSEINQPQQLVKAKSETSICSSTNNSATSPNRSRSLELVTGIPMWSESVTIVELNKGDYGLGFSILDYQDPLNTEETVIVIRSLVPGGVAQCDGRLIPGDRLLAVNDVNVKHASLDNAVQVLKGVPKGIVRIAVAKPLNTNDVLSHNTSPDISDDQTCLEDFQECLEEYQECLEVVHICIEEETSSNNSPCTSQMRGFNSDDQIVDNMDFLENNCMCVKETNSCTIDACNSDIEMSYKSSSNDLNLQTAVERLSHREDDVQLKNCLKNNNNKLLTQLIKADSLTQSDNNKVSSNQTQSSNMSEKDGYETCVDESLSEDSARQNDADEPGTPINEIHANILSSHIPSVNNYNNNTCTKKSDEAGPEERRVETPSGDNDEFFLVQYPPNDAPVISGGEFFSNYTIVPRNKIIFRRSIKEYYNDYKDCLELYRLDDNEEKKGIKSTYGSVDGRREFEDDAIFNDILLPFKSHSAPNIVDSTFVTMTYDPGPNLRRKSVFLPGHYDGHKSEMTVIRPVESNFDRNNLHVDNMLEKHWGSTHTIQLLRDSNSKSLGISIVGGKVDLNSTEKGSEETKRSRDGILGVFIKNVVEDSPAGRTGKFKTGDRILEVSGIDLRQATHEIAVEAIRSAPNPVTFVVQSINAWKSNDIDDGKEGTYQSPFPSPASVKLNSRRAENEKRVDFEENGKEEESVAVAIETRKVETSVEESDDEEDDEEMVDFKEMEGRTFNDKGHQIDRSSAANLRRSQEEIMADKDEEDEFGYTMNKVKKKYASLGHKVLMVQLERSHNQGLGLSLAGHKDRNCMAVFVCGLNPNGVAFKNGEIQIGDEILEVNGVVLHGRCHLNASAIIKGLSGPIFKVILLRRKAAIDDIAVKPITQFPISLAEEATEERFSLNYPNVRTVAIKKGSQSLGIMIIEGKHAEVGQGIFISDIQEGSSAQKAGLEIGEMILAVNKDILAGCNYEKAAHLLKRTEGLVTLVVSNPNRKDGSLQPNKNHTLTATVTNNALLVNNNKTNALTVTTLSRPTTPIPEIIDPTTCQIVPGKETTIELITDNKGLGIFFIGGKDTQFNSGIIIVEIYPGGMADKDARLKCGDQLLDVNGTSLKDCTQQSALQALRQTLPKMKLTVYRPQSVEYIPIDVDLMKKPGKGLGLSIVARKSGKGVYISDIINGGTADIDGRIIKGDILIQVNGQNVENSSGEEVGAVLKTVLGKVSLKLHRYKFNIIR